jgi:hypothetical protein
MEPVGSPRDLDVRAERYARQLVREFARHRERNRLSAHPPGKGQDPFEEWAIKKLADLQVVVEVLSEELMRRLEKPGEGSS